MPRWFSMKVICSTFSILSLLFCSAQNIPISAFTYENCTDIDHYFGETDTILLKYNIRKIKVFYKADTTTLINIETYKDGKKISVEDFDYKSGKLDRVIEYSYEPDALSAEMIHYPSADNYNIGPSTRFSYLHILKDGGLLFKRDTVTNIVKMRIHHTWLKDGNILFEGFDRTGKIVSTHMMKPRMPPDEYRRLPKSKYPMEIINDQEEYRYNEKGKLASYKLCSMIREDRYFYDDKGLLDKRERIIKGNLQFTVFYIYQ